MCYVYIYKYMYMYINFLASCIVFSDTMRMRKRRIQERDLELSDLRLVRGYRDYMHVLVTKYSHHRTPDIYDLIPRI